MILSYVRTIILYLVLILAIRLMGKRQNFIHFEAAFCRLFSQKVLDIYKFIRYNS